MARSSHSSERTLQRYSKDNSVFTFSVADRIFQIDKVIKKEVNVFGSAGLKGTFCNCSPGA